MTAKKQKDKERRRARKLADEAWRAVEAGNLNLPPLHYFCAPPPSFYPYLIRIPLKITTIVITTGFAMHDALYLAILAAFAALSWVLMVLYDRLRGGK